MTTEHSEATKRRLERIQRYKEQSLRAMKQGDNPDAPGISCVNVAPGDLLVLISAFEDSLTMKDEGKEND